MTVVVECNLEHRFGAARDQGQRPTCLAFALSDLNREYALAPGPLSAEYLYCQALAFSGYSRGSGLTINAGLNSVKQGQPEEAHAPYQLFEPSSPVIIPSIQDGAALFSSVFAVEGFELAAVEAAILGGRPVGLGVALTNSFFMPEDGVVAYEPDALPDSGHAVMAVGMGRNGSVRYFRIRNSWGVAWGDAGHAWVPVEYLLAHALCIFGKA